MLPPFCCAPPTRVPCLPARSRCTGYRPILDAFKAFAKSDPGAYTEEAIAASKAAGGAPAAAATNSQKQRVCPSSGLPCECGEADPTTGVVESRSEHKEKGCGPLTPGHPTTEPIFPPELRRREAPELALPGPRSAWYRPTTLASLLALKRQYPDAKLVVGNTGGWAWEQPGWWEPGLWWGIRVGGPGSSRGGGSLGCWSLACLLGCCGRWATQVRLGRSAKGALSSGWCGWMSAVGGLGGRRQCSTQTPNW